MDEKQSAETAVLLVPIEVIRNLVGSDFVSFRLMKWALHLRP